MKMKKSEKVIALVIIFFFISLIGAANYITVFNMDDLWYSTNLVTGEPIRGLKDIWESQVWHYFNWGGRSVAHTLLQFTLLGGRVLADICNTLCFIFLVLLLCKNRKKPLTYQVWDFIMVGGMLIALNANWLQTLLWQSGAANYLYTTTIDIAFLSLYINEFEKEDSSPHSTILLSILSAIGMFGLGVISGWTNENMGPMVFLISALVIVFSIYKKRKTAIWMYAGCVGSMIGSVIMILSPGNRVRSETIETSGKAIMDILQRIFTFLGASQKYLFATLIVLCILYVLLKFVLKIRMDKPTMFILIGALLSYLAMLVSPHYPDRATFGTLVLLIWAIERILNSICDENVNMNKGKRMLAVLFLMNSVYMYSCYILQMKKWIS